MNLGYPKFEKTPQAHRKSIRLKNNFEKNKQLCIDAADLKLYHSKNRLSASFMIICRKSIVFEMEDILLVNGRQDQVLFEFSMESTILKAAVNHLYYLQYLVFCNQSSATSLTFLTLCFLMRCRFIFLIVRTRSFI